MSTGSPQLAVDPPTGSQQPAAHLFTVSSFTKQKWRKQTEPALEPISQNPVQPEACLVLQVPLCSPAPALQSPHPPPALQSPQCLPASPTLWAPWCLPALRGTWSTSPGKGPSCPPVDHTQLPPVCSFVPSVFKCFPVY
nr:gibberellin-regulated protein 14-like [Paramormyrops kingsleyae]